MTAPPRQLGAGAITLVAFRGDEASKLTELIAANADHLRPWMPWAGAEPARSQYEGFVRRSTQEWASEDAFGYWLREEATGEIVGCAGLHRRLGPAALEIGYWVSSSHLRRGYATSSARALTSAAFALDDIERVEIHCDEANLASAGVPRRLGYRLDCVVDSVREAPTETGREMVWVVDAPAWLTRTA